MEQLQEQLNMLLGLGVYLDVRLSAIHSKRALFPYNELQPL